MAWFRRDRNDARDRRGADDAPSSSGRPGRQDRQDPPKARRVPLLQVEGLDVYYGRAHALQGVSLSLDEGVLGIVGRNGMGKTTLCNAITGLVPARGSVKLAGEEILGRSPHEITRRGIAYVPQGRRVWPSLSVDETLRLVASHRREVERVYTMFPRLAERKGNGGSQLSGGEQQMLAIGRALLLEPRLLVMDEPTEGLAPVIVEQVAQALRDLSHEGSIAVLLIEQNLGVATSVADRIGIMVNGRIAQEMPAAELAADRELQERLLGVRSHGGDEPEDAAAAQEAAGPAQAAAAAESMATGCRRCTTCRPAPCGATTAGTRARPWRPWSTELWSPRTPQGPLPRQGRFPARASPSLRPSSTSRSPPPVGAPPTWPAPSTPRAASCSTCASAWRSSACAW